MSALECGAGLWLTIATLANHQAMGDIEAEVKRLLQPQKKGQLQNSR